MRKMKILKLLKLFLRKSDENQKYAFLELISSREFSYLGLDLLNCFLISKKQPIIPDNNINIILNSDIIKSYSPQKRDIIKKEL